MAKFELNDPQNPGDSYTVESDTPLTPEEANAALDQIRPKKNPLQTLAQGATTFIRGYKGIGVGVEGAINKMFGKDSTNTLGAPDPQSWSQVADRAAEATKPGFKPKYGEKAGAALGEMAATAPIFAATGGGGIGAQMAKSALASGGLDAIQQESDKGNVHVGEVVKSAVTGGVVPLLVPGLNALAKGIEKTGSTMVRVGTTVKPFSIEAMRENPQMLEQFTGLADEIGNKVLDIQKALLKSHDEAGALLDAARAKIGFKEPFRTVLNRVEQQGFKPPTIQEVIGDFKILEKDTIPVDFVREARTIKSTTPGKLVTSGNPTEETLQAADQAQIAQTTKDLTGQPLPKAAPKSKSPLLPEGYDPNADQAMEYTTILKKIPEKTITKDVALPAKARLRDLYRLRQNISDMINWKGQGDTVQKIGSADEAFLKQMYNKINKIVADIPGGKALRAADEAYSSSRQLFDELQSHIATPGKAEDFVHKLVGGGNVDEMIGQKGAYLDLIKKIEKAKKVELIGPAKQSFAARNVNTMDNTAWTGLPMSIAGPTGVAKVINASTKMGQGLRAGAAALDPASGSGSGIQSLLKAAAARR